MTKNEFLDSLRHSLKSLPRQDVDRIIDYYNEIIEDKIEAGDEETLAVASVGSVEEIACQALADKNTKKPKKQKMSKQQWAVLIAGSPLWISLLLSAVAVIISLYACAWSAVVSLGAVEVSLLASGAYGICYTFFVMFTSGATMGFLVLGVSFLALGLSLLLLFPTVKLFKYSAILTKTSMLKLVKLAIGGGQQ